MKLNHRCFDNTIYFLLHKRDLIQSESEESGEGFVPRATESLLCQDTISTSGLVEIYTRMKQIPSM